MAITAAIDERVAVIAELERQERLQRDRDHAEEEAAEDRAAQAARARR